MQIYSDTALVFLKKVRAFSFDILKNEMGLPFQKKRLLFNGRYYPLDFVVFDHEKILGEYDPSYFQIRINKQLIYKSNDFHLKNIIRHELAHYITHLIFGTDIFPHGKEFLSVCNRFKFHPEVSSASIEISTLVGKNEKIEETKVLKKVKKLLNLAQSQNEHEARLATIKANKLLHEHNLNLLDYEDEDKETVLLKALRTKKLTGKYQAIYKILHHFFVAPVFSYGQGVVHLEIIGEKSNVLCAEYIAHYLDHTLEKLYDTEKRNRTISGVRAKNSFMKGVADGFIQKIKKESHGHDNAIIKTEKNLQIHVSRVYPKMRGRKVAEASTDLNARSLGEDYGKNLSITPGIPNKKKPKLLSF